MSTTLNVHHNPEPNTYTQLPDPHQDSFSRTILGFWMYLMTDCLLFGTLFVTYAVLHNSTFGGPSSRDLFSLQTAFMETMILLFSSVTCGFAMIAATRSKTNQAIIWFAVTCLLGASFLTVELNEFSHLVHEGHSWKQSAFLSSFFTLVGTHGLHVTFGMLWMFVMIGQLYLYGITVETFRRLVIFSMFWHFLDLVWIFIFTFVYLMGVA
ncbi:MAG: cytochrome o ubiquinol oxidase subunit III [Chlamydiales bacterium]|nr:cytochrome o ubiquinol oxidase subunit III [Chlamydiales bacterium]